MASISQIISTINPDLYHNGNVKEFKKLIAKEGFQKAAEKADPKADGENLIVYDSATEQLEPLYFWTLDFMNDAFGLDVEKLVDNFTSSPGSGHFSELGLKSTAMQQQGTKILADINTVLRSVLNVIYDLKEFKLRLSQYDGLKMKDKPTQEAAKLALKQIWMDKVDMQKGAGSINALASGQLGFQTLRDAFLAVKDEKEVGKLDLNDRVKRILKPRIQEFNVWIGESEKELRKRYELERNYLKSQVNSLKLYSRWVKPYLKSTVQLEQSERGRNPGLVNTFNTLVLELTILGKDPVSLPPEIGEKPKKQKRKYYKCVLVDFTFRGIPQKSAQHYTFGGRTEIRFKAYALNEDELKKLDQELAKSDVGDVLKLIEGATDDSLGKIQEEIDSFLDEEEEGVKEEKTKDTSNPFSALFGLYNKEDKPKKPTTQKIEKVNPDTWFESTHIRAYAQEQAKETAFKIFDIYKKVHGMASYT